MAFHDEAMASMEMNDVNSTMRMLSPSTPRKYWMPQDGIQSNWSTSCRPGTVRSKRSKMSTVPRKVMTDVTTAMTLTRFSEPRLGGFVNRIASTPSRGRKVTIVSNQFIMTPENQELRIRNPERFFIPNSQLFYPAQKRK